MMKDDPLNNSARKPLQNFILFSVIGLFLITRIFLALWHDSPGSDTVFYGIDALEFREAVRKGASVYEIHQKMELANAKRIGIADLPKQQQIMEYPPLAILWESVPVFFVGGDQELDGFTQAAQAAWKHLFKIFYLIFESAIFLVLLWLWLKPTEFLKTDLAGLGLYVITGVFLGHFLYDRQDLFLGGLIFFSLVLLLSRLHWTAALFMLAVGINFKLVPVLLIPVFLIGSLPGEYHKCLYEDVFNRGFLLALLKRIVYLTAMVFGIFAPFYLWAGKATLDFILYHSERGLQLESTYSSLLMVLSFIGLPVHVTHGFGAYNIDSPLAPFFLAISTPLVAIMVLGITFVLIVAIKRHFFRTGTSIPARIQRLNLAQTMPQTFICLTIATLLAGMSAAKVFSAQYIIWVIPLFALLAYENKRNLTIGILFAAACVFTAAIPSYYFTEFVHHQMQLPDGSVIWAAPTPTAVFILFSRNILLIATTIMLLFAAVSEKQINAKA